MYRLSFVTSLTAYNELYNKYFLKWGYDRRSRNYNFGICKLTPPPSPPKFRNFNGIWTHGLRVSAAVLDQLSHEDPYSGRRPKFVEFICWEYFFMFGSNFVQADRNNIPTKDTCIAHRWIWQQILTACVFQIAMKLWSVLAQEEHKIRLYK